MTLNVVLAIVGCATGVASLAWTRFDRWRDTRRTAHERLQVLPSHDAHLGLMFVIVYKAVDDPEALFAVITLLSPANETLVGGDPRSDVERRDIGTARAFSMDPLNAGRKIALYMHGGLGFQGPACAVYTAEESRALKVRITIRGRATKRRRISRVLTIAG